MRIGIIAERRTKLQNFFERYQRQIIYNEKNPFEPVVVTIPYTAERLDGMSPRRIRRAVSRAEEILKGMEAEEIVAADLLKDYCDSLKDRRNQLFFDIIPHCIRSVAPKCGIYPPDCKICIRVDKMDRIIEYLAAELCYDTKKLTICTPDQKAAADFRERFFDETGFLAEIIAEYDGTDAEIVADLRALSVRIGRDVLIDGAQLDFDVGGCDVDFLEIAACIKGFDASKRISAYLMGKKKLTL